jgi:hypothetical protein
VIPPAVEVPVASSLFWLSLATVFHREATRVGVTSVEAKAPPDRELDKGQSRHHATDVS